MKDGGKENENQRLRESACACEFITAWRVAWRRPVSAQITGLASP